MKRFVLLVMLLSRAGLTAGWWDQVLWGPEFTFTNTELSGSSDGVLKKSLMKKLFTSLESAAKSRRYNVEFTDLGEVKVSYPDGYWFLLTSDRAVIEVKAKPSTFAMHSAHAADLERDLWATMKNVAQLEPHEYRGGGHLTFSHPIFQEKPKIFRQFFADYSNHSGVAGGGLHLNSRNARPFSELPLAAQKQAQATLQDFDKHPESLASLIGSLVDKSYGHPESTAVDGSRVMRNQALNLNNAVEALRTGRDPTFEIRAVKPQKSAQDFVDELKLFTQRFAYIDSVAAPIALQIGRPLNAATAWSDLSDYARGAKLDPQSYQHFMNLGFQQELGFVCAGVLSRVH